MREFCSCSCLTALPGLAWVLLSNFYIPFCSPLYNSMLNRFHAMSFCLVHRPTRGGIYIYDIHKILGFVDPPPLPCHCHPRKTYQYCHYCRMLFGNLPPLPSSHCVHWEGEGRGRFPKSIICTTVHAPKFISFRPRQFVRKRASNHQKQLHQLFFFIKHICTRRKANFSYLKYLRVSLVCYLFKYASSR